MINFGDRCFTCECQISEIYRYLCRVKRRTVRIGREVRQLDLYMCPICQRAIIKNDVTTILKRYGNYVRYGVYPIPLTDNFIVSWQDELRNTDIYALVRKILMKEIWSMPTMAVANKYRMSDKAVEKQCKIYDIPKPPRGFWNKYNAGYYDICYRMIPVQVKEIVGLDYLQEHYYIAIPATNY